MKSSPPLDRASGALPIWRWTSSDGAKIRKCLENTAKAYNIAVIKVTGDERGL